MVDAVHIASIARGPPKAACKEYYATLRVSSSVTVANNLPLNQADPSPEVQQWHPEDLMKAIKMLQPESPKTPTVAVDAG